MIKLPKINDYGLLRERAYSILKSYIIEGELKEGAKITEAEISKQLGVSTTPVREAIRMLAVEGLITINPNKRMVISQITTEDVIEVYELRKVLCGLAAKLLAEKITEQDVLKFNSIMAEMEAFAENDDFKRFSGVADQFHTLISQLSGNKRLERFSNILHDQVYRFRIKSLKVEGRMKKSLDEHKRILEALKKRNSKLSFKYCQEHLNNALENILQNTLG